MYYEKHFPMEVDYIPLSLYKYIVMEVVNTRTAHTVVEGMNIERIDEIKNTTVRMRFPNSRGLALLIETETPTILHTHNGATETYSERVDSIMICPLIYTGDGASDCHYVYEKVTNIIDGEPYTFEKPICAQLSTSTPAHTRDMIAFEAQYIITQPNPGCEKCKAFWWYQIGKNVQAAEGRLR